MSHAQDDHDLPHEGPIKTPKQLVWAVLLSFVVPIIAILLLVSFVTASKQPAAGSDGLSPQAIAQRLRPVGQVEVRDTSDPAAMKTGQQALAQRLQKVGSVEIKDLSDPASMKTGEQVYGAQCVACHGSGAAGAPKLGDAGAWGPRVKTGYDALLASALKGKGSMGAQGGGDFSDFEIGRAVVYMANQSGGKFEQPKLPAAAASAAP